VVRDVGGSLRRRMGMACNGVIQRLELSDMHPVSLLVAAAIALNASAAVALCKRPEKPSCATETDKFGSRGDIDDCKRNVEDFKENVKTYADCVKKDAEQLGKNVKKAAEDFQRRAEKGVSGQ
jgi:hypothetical protein